MMDWADALRSTTKVSLGSAVFLLLLLSTSSTARGQAVSGRVLDAQTGETLPAATIHVANTFRGTITNAEGEFELNPRQWPADLVVRFIGYRTDTVRVAEAGVITVRLQPALIELATLIVTDEDPAIGIMREVIRRKQIWRADLDTYKALAYARLVFASDEEIVAISEAVSTTWWARDRGVREIKSGGRDTGNIPFGDDMPAAIFMLNLYDDDIELGGHTLIGVTHPSALSSYDFTLLRSRRIDESVIHDIEVAPRNDLVSGFTGRLSVLEDDYAMVDVELRPGEAFLFPSPINSYEVTLRQQFFNFGTTAWLPVDLRSESEIEISFGPLLAFPTVKVDVIGRFTDYQLNIPVPDSLFAGDTYMVLDSTAMESGEVFEEEGIVVPYTPVESLAYEAIDSTMNLAEQYAPEGPFGRMLRAQQAAEEQSGRFSSANWPDINPRLRFNRVDGLHAGLEVTRELGRFVQLRGGGGWSSELTGSDKWSYDGALRLSSDRDDAVDFFLEGGFRAGTAQTYLAEQRPLFANTLSVLLASREDYYDYYRSEGQFVTAGMEAGNQPHTVDVTWKSETHTQLPLTTSYDVFGRKEPQRPNGIVVEGTLKSITVAWGIGEPPIPIFGAVSGVRRFKFVTEHSLAGSDMRFRRYFASGYWRVNTLLKRRLLPATLDLHAVLGTSSGDLPPQRVHIVETGTGNFLPFGTLRAYEGLPYTGKHVAAFYWEHNFRTIPFELVGIRGLARRGYNILVFGGHAWIRDATWEERHEIGVSLSGLLGLFRIDVAIPLNESGVRLGYGVARVF